jgi:hypothetical protein
MIWHIFKKDWKLMWKSAALVIALQLALAFIQLRVVFENGNDSLFGPVTARPFRIGFAAQGDSGFCRAVMRSVEEAAAREHVDLITVNNRYSAGEAVRNADLLIKERVDLVLEYQTHELVAPVIASKFSRGQHSRHRYRDPSPRRSILRRQQLQGRPHRRQGSRPLGARAMAR